MLIVNAVERDFLYLQAVSDRDPVAIPVTAGIRGFARIPVPAKCYFIAGIPYRDYTLNLVIKT